MTEEHISTKLTFTFEPYTCMQGCGSAYISDGVSEAHVFCSCTFGGSPLLELVSAVARLRLYEESRCEWSIDFPKEYVWFLRRESNFLHIAIQGLLENSEEEGRWKKKSFSITCDLWKFATKLRRECNRLMARWDAEKKHGGDWLRQSKEYQALCEFIEEHKRQEMSFVSLWKAQ